MSLVNSSRCLFLHIYHYEELMPYVMATCVLNIVLCIPNIAGSAVILAAMFKNPNLEQPKHIHLCSLALADFVTGLVVQPLFVVHKLAWMYGFESVDCVARLTTEIVAWISSAVSCSTIGLISLDRMLAVRLHMKYQLYVNRGRTLNLTIAIWVVMIFMSFSRFVINNIRHFVICGVVGILAGSLQVFIAYGQIYKYMKLHHRKIAAAQLQMHSSSTRDCDTVDHIDTQMSGKAVKIKSLWKSSMNLAYVVGIYVAVYLPFVSVLIAFILIGQTPHVDIAYDITRTLIFCASVFNPILYCWKIKDIKVEVNKTLSRLGRGTKVAAGLPQ